MAFAERLLNLALVVLEKHYKFNYGIRVEESRTLQFSAFELNKGSSCHIFNSTGMSLELCWLLLRKRPSMLTLN